VECLPALCAIAVAYVLWLRPMLRRWEASLLLLVPVIVCTAVQPAAVLVTVIVSIAALSLGDMLTVLMRFEADDAPVAWTAGFGGLILIVAFLGKAGLLSIPWLAGVLALLLLRAAFVWRRLSTWCASPFMRWSASHVSGETVTGVSVFFLFLFAGCSVLLMLTPVTAFDVLAYHFPLAGHYAETHFINPSPAILESYYPQGGEALLALGFVLGGAHAAQLLTPVLGLLCLWLVVRIGRACGLGHTACIVGASIAFTFPFLHWTVTIPKDDAALAIFQLAALYCFLQWQRGRGGQWLPLGSFFLGQTAGIKHVALFGLVAISPLWLWSWVRDGLPRRRIALSVLLFAGAGLFWHLQTFILTGNFLFPESATSAGHLLFLEHRTGALGGLTRYVTLPWYLLFRGTKAFESPTANPLGIFLFMLAPALLELMWVKAWTPARKACFAFALFYLAYWASVSSTLRYAIVPFILLALASGAAFVWLMETRSQWLRGALLVACCYGFLFSFVAVLTFEVNSLQLAYVFKRITAREYLEAALPTTGSLFRLAARSPGASVFGVTNCSRFYAPNPLQFSCALCATGCAPAEVMPLIEAGHFDFVILPNQSADTPLTALLRTRFNLSQVDRDRSFLTFKLDGRK
jgi:hypothetical protein